MAYSTPSPQTAMFAHTVSDGYSGDLHSSMASFSYSSLSSLDAYGMPERLNDTSSSGESATETYQSAEKGTRQRGRKTLTKRGDLNVKRVQFSVAEKGSIWTCETLPSMSSDVDEAAIDLKAQSKRDNKKQHERCSQNFLVEGTSQGGEAFFPSSNEAVPLQQENVEAACDAIASMVWRQAFAKAASKTQAEQRPRLCSTSSEEESVPEPPMQPMVRQQRLAKHSQAPSFPNFLAPPGLEAPAMDCASDRELLQRQQMAMLAVSKLASQAWAQATQATARTYLPNNNDDMHYVSL